MVFTASFEVASTVVPCRMSAPTMLFSGLAPSSLMSADQDVGFMRISSWVVGTPVRRKAFASTCIFDRRGRFGNSKLPFAPDPTTRDPWVSAALTIP
jgi:hypothetical protein